MSKAKKAAEHETAHIVTPAPTPPGLSAICREALGELGMNCSIHDVEAYIKAKYHALDFNRNTLSATLSGQRSKLGGTGGRSENRLLAPSLFPVRSQEEPTGLDLMKVKKLADANGGLEELLAQVQRVNTLAQDVGGMNKLLKSLEMLHELVLR